MDPNNIEITHQQQEFEDDDQLPLQATRDATIQDVSFLPGDDVGSSGSMVVDSNPPKKKRNRKPVTCAQCRKRKLKCDRGNPCGACRDRNEGHLCSWEDAIRLPQLNATRDQEALELRSQLDRLESLLGQLHHSTYTSGELDPFRDHGRESSSHEGLGLVTEAPGADQPLGLFPFTSNPSMERVVSVLPLRFELDGLVKTFTTELLWMVPIFRVPTFYHRYSNFERPTHRSDPFFIALELAIAGFVNYHRPPDGRPKVDGFKDTTVRSFMVASMEALHAGKYLQNPNSDAVRALILMHAYYSRFDHGTGGALLSMCFQIGERLGLSREPTRGTSENPIEVEEYRRMWGIMLCADWLQDSSRFYRCPQTHYDTQFPANAPEEAVTMDGIISHPLSTPTHALFLVLKLQIAAAARDITDRAYSIHMIPNYQTILDLNHELTRVESAVPSSLAIVWEHGQVKTLPQNAQPLDFAKISISLLIKSQFIRLHRPFITRGYGDPRFTFSRDMVTQSARLILAIHRGLGADHQAFRLWDLQFHVCNALCVLALDLYQDPNGSHSEIGRADISSALAILEQLDPRPDMVRDTLSTIHAIVSRARRLPVLGGDPLKQKRDGDDVSVSGRESNISNRGSDMGFFLQGNRDSHSHMSLPGLPGMSSNQIDPMLRPFDSNVPFMRPLPIPLSVDTAQRQESLKTMEKDMATVWDALMEYPAFYALPDREEWMELLSTNGKVWFHDGIDLLGVS